jgi:butyrate kinase
LPRNHQPFDILRPAAKHALNHKACARKAAGAVISNKQKMSAIALSRGMTWV